MWLPVDLLQQAEHLAELEATGPPRQASLRRAISSAYYALFHLLTYRSAEMFFPKPLRPRVQRAFDHGKMKDVCRGIANGTVPPATAQMLQDGNFPPEIRRVAVTFLKLQEARQIADYDTVHRFPEARRNSFS